MSRLKRNVGIDTRNKRLKLEARREPHWAIVTPGCALGYRKGSNGGSWIARYRTKDGKQIYEAIGQADDITDDIGGTVMSFARAQKAAQAWFEARERNEMVSGSARRSGPLTVSDALDEYFLHRMAETTKPKSVYADKRSAETRIKPTLGDVEVDKLTAVALRQWRDQLATSDRMVRTSKKAAAHNTRPVDLEDPDTLRRRRATANKILTVLKAALNHAFREGLTPTDQAWRRVKPFTGVDAPVVHFLGEDECRRLLNACAPDFRLLVHGALVTGARYGELCRMEARDYVPESGIVRVRESKSGKPRSIVLTDEGQKLFSSLVAGKVGEDLIFTRSNGAPWKASEQARPLASAAAAAKIEPAPTFHVLRHTHASWLAMRGVPLNVIAAQLGHSDTRITEKHYAHLAPSYVADTIRAHFPTISTGDTAPKVVSLRG